MSSRMSGLVDIERFVGIQKGQAEVGEGPGVEKRGGDLQFTGGRGTPEEVEVEELDLTSGTAR